MACEANPDSQYGQDQYKNKVKILILPTVFKTTADPKVSEHLTDMKSKLEIYATSGNIESYSSTILKKNYFDKIYRKNPGTGVKPSKDSLSQSIWIDSCVIVTLDNILKNNPTTHDGVNFSMAAYKTKNPKLQSQLYPNQSTVILIPTKPNASGSHDSDWAIIEAFIRAKIYKAVSAGLNHGELCPTKCN